MNSSAHTKRSLSLCPTCPVPSTEHGSNSGADGGSCGAADSDGADGRGTAGTSSRSNGRSPATTQHGNVYSAFPFPQQRDAAARRLQLLSIDLCQIALKITHALIATMCLHGFVLFVVVVAFFPSLSPAAGVCASCVRDPSLPCAVNHRVSEGSTVPQ